MLTPSDPGELPLAQFLFFIHFALYKSLLFFLSMIGLSAGVSGRKLFESVVWHSRRLGGRWFFMHANPILLTRKIREKDLSLYIMN